MGVGRLAIAGVAAALITLAGCSNAARARCRAGRRPRRPRGRAGTGAGHHGVRRCRSRCRSRSASSARPSRFPPCRSARRPPASSCPSISPKATRSPRGSCSSRSTGGRSKPRWSRRRPTSHATKRRPPTPPRTTKRFQDLADRGIAARADLDTSKASLSALNATVAADRAAIENAKVQLEYATINAPLTGRTGALQVHEGNLVRANDSTSLVVINQIMPIQVAFSLPEARLTELKRYMARGALRVLASPPNDDAPPAVGRISFIDNSVDPHDRHDQGEGHVPERRSPPVAGPVRERDRGADHREERHRGRPRRRCRPVSRGRSCSW